LVENVPHRGARVTELSGEDLQQIYEARLALEPLAIRRAAMSFSEEAAADAQRELEIYRAALRDRDEAKSLQAHTRFHFALYTQSGSTWLVRLITPLWESSERYRLSLPVAPQEKRLREHDRILSACVSHQPDVAAAELHNHLARTANAVAKQVGDGQLFSLLPVPTGAKASPRRAAKG
jgi:DNA-binding GntR family transcriptional regulator